MTDNTPIAQKQEHQPGHEIRDGKLVITLHEPITFTANKLDGERTVIELVMPTRVKGKHLRAMDKAQGEIGKTLVLIAKLAGVPEAAMDELDAQDLELCQEALAPFLPQPRETGTR